MKTIHHILLLTVLLLLLFTNVSHASNPNISIDDIKVDGNNALTVTWTLLSKSGIQAISGQRVWGIYPSVNGNLTSVVSGIESLRCDFTKQPCVLGNFPPRVDAIWHTNCSNNYLPESGYVVGNQYTNTFTRVRNAENTAWVQVGDLTSSDAIRFSFFSTEGGNFCTANTLKFVDSQDYEITFPGPAEPVVIIPGFLGSEEKNGQLILQPRLKPYDSLKLTLLANGYTEGETLFDFPYDWRKSNVVTASLLKDKIQEIKNICQCDKVDVVAHSMGGLAARQYIQSNLYQNDIDQLIFLGTPHIGAPKAYLAWEGGIAGPTFLDLFVEALIRQEAIEAGFREITPRNRNIFDYIHSSSSPMLSLQELLPVYDYLKEFGTGVLRQYPANHPQNIFLEDLNSSSSLSVLEQSGVEVSNIFSDNQEDTISFIKVEDDASLLPMWENGVSKVLEGGAGDGTVPLISSLSLNVSNSTDLNMEGAHLNLPAKGVDEIYQILTGQPPAQIITIPKIKRFLSIFGLSPIDILVTAPDGKRIGKDFVTGQEFNEIDGAYYTGFNTPNENIFIPEPLDGEYTITTQGTGSGSYEILTDYVREEDSGEATSTVVSFTANTSNEVIENLRFTFSSSTPEAVEIVPEDVTAPAITHTDIPGEVLLDTPSTIFNFSAQDDLTGVFNLTATLDGEPIENGTVIDFITPGRHTVEIRAEDLVGNVATETIGFDVVYNFGGPLPPIKTDGSGIYKLGRTLPVKFQLTDADNQFISTAVAQLFIAKIQDGVVGTEEIPLSTSSADVGNFFRYDQTNNQYIYNLSTKTMSVGAWQLKIILDDGRDYTVIVSIK